jgi:hypothetical protein
MSHGLEEEKDFDDIETKGGIVDLDPPDFFQHIDFNSVEVPDEDGEAVLTGAEMTQVLKS